MSNRFGNDYSTSNPQPSSWLSETTAIRLRRSLETLFEPEHDFIKQQNHHHSGETSQVQRMFEPDEDYNQEGDDSSVSDTEQQLRQHVHNVFPVRGGSELRQSLGGDYSSGDSPLRDNPLRQEYRSNDFPMQNISHQRHQPRPQDRDELLTSENSSDLSKLSDLTEDSVLRVVQHRYRQDQIYTRCGDVLISVNPFKQIHIFGEEHHQLYHPEKLASCSDPEAHIYWIASLAVSRRIQEGDQVVLVSGESGAGKTEATKLMLKHLLYLTGGKMDELRTKIDDVNPLLELFGNAKTILNENSSRYAKFLEIGFTKEGKISGAIIRDYILEKCRVVTQSKHECNFHIFYTFLDYVKQFPEKQQMFLMEGMDTKKDFRIVPPSSWSRNQQRMNCERQIEAFKDLGFTQDEIDNIHTILAAILHLTNIRFEEDEGSSPGVVIVNEDTMNKAASLLGANEEALTTVLVSDQIMYGAEKIQTLKNMGKAEEARDAIAKALYERTFGWIVRKVNTSLNQKPSESAKIGFLDICGFENLERNSLEQLCINLVNENLQSFMNQRVFVHEMSEYQLEGIQIEGVTPPTNESIIRMFNQPRTGIIMLINEDSRNPGLASDESLVGKMNQMHGNSPEYICYKTHQPCFGVKHFAGEVRYSARNFLEKNRDQLSDDIIKVMQSSENELIGDLFTVNKAKTLTGSISMSHYNYRASRKHSVRFRPHGGQMNLSQSVVRGLRQSQKDRFGSNRPKPEQRKIPNSQKTVLDYFQGSMKDMIDKLKMAKPMFVRCIKPNDEQKPDRFQDEKVRAQLRYNGVTEIARIRHECFPVRLDLKTFIEKYSCLSESSKAIENKQQAVMAICKDLYIPPELFKLGKTKVFLKDSSKAVLERAWKELKEKEEAERKRKAKEEEEKRQRAIELKEKNRKDKEIRQQSLPLPAMQPIQEVPTPASTVDDPDYNTSSLTRSARNLGQSTTSTVATSLEEEVSTTDELEDQEAEKKDETPAFWDIFRIVPREQPTTDLHELKAIKVMKFSAYVILFLLVLFTATVQKMSLMIMISEIKPSGGPVEGERARITAYYILLLIAVCIPYFLTFLLSLGKIAFGGYQKPSLVTWIFVLVMESLHSLGLSVLVFRVLPRMAISDGLLLLSVAGVLPALLKPAFCVSVNENGSTKLKVVQRVWTGIVNILALLGQLSAFPLVFLLRFVEYEEAEKILDVVTVFLLVGFSHWENYMDGNFFISLKDSNKWKNFILKRRYELQKGRYIPLLLSSVLKIIVSVVMAYVCKPAGSDFDYQGSINILSKLSNQYQSITAIIVLTISAFVCYYSAYIACTLWMQKISFSFPLTLATPMAYAIFVLDHHYNFLHNATNSVLWPETESWRKLLVGGIWWLSLLLLTYHIWIPHQSRLAKVELLFMTPCYCGILTTENMLLNRRRHTLQIKKVRMDKETLYYKLSHSESKDESDYASAAGSDTYTQINDVEGNLEGNNNPTTTNTATERQVPMIYACATMWHEVRREMLALMKSLHRLDLEQYLRRQAEEISGAVDPDAFNYEAHVFVDDAMTIDDEEDVIANDWVKQIVELMEEAVSAVHNRTMFVSPPSKVITPYGGQLIWVMPGGNLLFVHMKDKAKIRHRKRWSQVMYMFYLLGFRLTRQCQENILQQLKSSEVENERIAWRLKRDEIVGSDIFDWLTEDVYIKSQNTFILALDGDTDFSPRSVHILLDRMKQDPKVAAACGRIHPIGSGPLVWYQMFEYAIGHWMQKATEHVLGCVLCSPGCFSLFRGSALMDDNVMKKYTIMPTEPSHFLQYDQGEDRWLCTLLLQQGYRVDYAAAADAWTYAPEGFNEFFNQRRRWMPSTLANIMDLLADYANTVAVNSNISKLYIAYQVALMFATIIGPGTVLMMIAGALGVVFGLDLLWSYVVSTIPAAVFFIVCLTCKTNIQLYLAGVLTAFYSFVMMVVFVGTLDTAVRNSFFHPSVIVFTLLVIVFVVAAVFHPLEWVCLPPGFIYLLCLPSGYLLLVIYSLCNLHVVSWGTREVPKKKTKAEEEQEKKEAEEKMKQKAQKGFIGRFLGASYLHDLKELLQSITGSRNNQDKNQENAQIQLLIEMNDTLKKLSADKENQPFKSVEATVKEPHPTSVISRSVKKDKIKPKKSVKIVEKKKPVRNDMVNPKWIEDKGLGDGEVVQLFQEEIEFWQKFIPKYLKPLDADKEKEKKLAESMIDLRNSVCFAMAMINLLWMALNFMFQLKAPVVIPLHVLGSDLRLEILGLLFVIFLLVVLFLQIVGMFVHRWGTLLHLLAFTELDLPCRKRNLSLREQEQQNFKKIFNFCKQIYKEPIPDYLEDNDLEKPSSSSMAEKLRKTILGNSAHHQPFIHSVRGGAGTRDYLGKSRAVDLLLRATVKNGRNNEDDFEAMDFHQGFRQAIDEKHKSFRGSRLLNGDALQMNGVAGASRRLPLPQPEDSPIKRRRTGTNFRYAARNVIERAQREASIYIRPGVEDNRIVDNDNRNHLFAKRPTQGRMDLAFSRRLDMFEKYRQEEGRHFESGIHDV